MALTDIIPMTWSDGVDPINRNTDFEDDISDWTAINSATLSQSSSQVHAGSFSLSFHGTGAIATPGAISERCPVMPGVSYVGTSWFFNTIASSGVNVLINWYDSTNTFLSSNTSGTVSLPTSTWTQASVTATAPANATYASLQIQAVGTPAVGSIFFADDASLVGKSPLNDVVFNTEVRDSYALQLSPPSAQITNTAAQTFTAASWIQATMNTAVYDTLSDSTPQWASGTPNKLTCQLAGWYEINASMEFNNPTGFGFIISAVQKGATTSGSSLYGGSSVSTNNLTFGVLDVSVNVLVQLATGDDMYFMIYNSTGANVASLASGYTPFFSMTRRRGI